MKNCVAIHPKFWVSLYFLQIHSFSIEIRLLTYLSFKSKLLTKIKTALYQFLQQCNWFYETVLTDIGLWQWELRQNENNIYIQVFQPWMLSDKNILKILIILQLIFHYWLMKVIECYWNIFLCSEKHLIINISFLNKIYT